jgi:hypothetical protein
MKAAAVLVLGVVLSVLSVGARSAESDHARVDLPSLLEKFSRDNSGEARNFVVDPRVPTSLTLNGRNESELDYATFLDVLRENGLEASKGRSSAIVIRPIREQAPCGAPLPPNVSCDRWVALGLDWGFVVVAAEPSSSAGVARKEPTVEGYFMARRNGVWVRLEPDSRPRVLPAS